MKQTRLGWLWVVPTLALAGACGDDGGDGEGNDAGGGGGGSSGNVSLGLDTSAVVSGLSEAELTSGCDSFAATLSAELGDELTRFACVLTGFVASNGDTATCEAEADMCVADPPEDDAAASDDCVAQLSDCGATVGEVEACANSFVSEGKSLLPSVTCEAFADEDMQAQLLQAGDDLLDSPSCQTLTSKCPNFEILSQ